MRTLFCTAVLLSLVVTAHAESFSGKVVGISDGDTIRVIHNGAAERVRLWGIDCPEKRQPFGTRARQFTGDLAFGKDVTVEVRDVDRYGRTVGEIILPDGRNLNRELVKAGLAWWYRQYARGDRELDRLEDRRGLRGVDLGAIRRRCRRGSGEERGGIAGDPPFRQVPKTGLTCSANLEYSLFICCNAAWRFRLGVSDGYADCH